jgi:hypothetical protein
MQNTGHYTEAMYVQAAKANSSNRIIVEKDLINLPNESDRNYKSMEQRKTEEGVAKEKCRKRIWR